MKNKTKLCDTPVERKSKKEMKKTKDNTRILNLLFIVNLIILNLIIKI